MAFLAASILSGLALVFTLAGLAGLVATLVAMRAAAYHLLSTRYQTGPIRRESQLAGA